MSLTLGTDSGPDAVSGGGISKTARPHLPATPRNGSGTANGATARRASPRHEAASRSWPCRPARIAGPLLRALAALLFAGPAFLAAPLTAEAQMSEIDLTPSTPASTETPTIAYAAGPSVAACTVIAPSAPSDITRAYDETWNVTLPPSATADRHNLRVLLDGREAKVRDIGMRYVQQGTRLETRAGAAAEALRRQYADQSLTLIHRARRTCDGQLQTADVRFALTFTDSTPVDTTPPTATVTAPDTHDGSAAFDIAVQFSENVTGFALTDISVTGGTASALTGQGSIYGATVIPTATNAVTISVAADAADDAAGNGNTASGTATVAYAAPPPVSTLALPTPPDLTWTAGVVNVSAPLPEATGAVGDGHLQRDRASELAGVRSGHPRRHGHGRPCVAGRRSVSIHLLRDR